MTKNRDKIVNRDTPSPPVRDCALVTPFRPCPSGGLCMPLVTNDLLMAADAGSPSLLILLDLTAAFDTVDHNILLYHLRHTISLYDSVYNWFSSYLTGRMEYVALGEAKSLTHNVPIPQWPHSVYTLCAPSRSCHQPAWNIISLSC